MSLNEIKNLHEDCVKAVQNKDIKVLIERLRRIQDVAHSIRSKIESEQMVIVKRMTAEIITGSTERL